MGDILGSIDHLLLPLVSAYADHKRCNIVNTHCNLRMLLAQGAQIFCCLLNKVAIESDIYSMKDASCGLDDYVYIQMRENKMNPILLLLSRLVYKSNGKS